MVGAPPTLSVGTPLGSFAGTLLGRHLTFATLSVLSLALIAWVIAYVGVPGRVDLMLLVIGPAALAGPRAGHGACR